MLQADFTFTDPKYIYGSRAAAVLIYGLDQALQNPLPFGGGRVDFLWRFPDGAMTITVAPEPQAKPEHRAAQRHLLCRLVLLYEDKKLLPGEVITLQTTGYDYDDPMRPLYPALARSGYPIARQYTRFTLHTLHGDTALSITQHYASTNRARPRGSTPQSLDHEIICADLPQSQREGTSGLFLEQRLKNPSDKALLPALKAIPLKAPKR